MDNLSMQVRDREYTFYMEELNIRRVEYKCRACGKWVENETGVDFYRPMICFDCYEPTEITQSLKVTLYHKKS